MSARDWTKSRTVAFNCEAVQRMFMANTLSILIYMKRDYSNYGSEVCYTMKKLT